MTLASVMAPAVFKPISSLETTNELLEISQLFMVRTKGTTGCSSALHFLLSEAFDAELKAPSPIWGGLRFKNLLSVVLFTDVFCNARLQCNEGISRSHESNGS